MKLKARLLISVAIMSSALGANAAVSPEEAKQLGSTLTLWGAEKAGNKDGAIPAYEGPVKIPASYDPKKPSIRPDPYANEKPLFSVNAQNMDKYADKLSDGMKAMMKRYPTFRIDVYPSHRNAVYPKHVLDNTLKNATSCRTEDEGLALAGCYAGLPFPIPKTGNEVMWNHVLRWTAYNWIGDAIQSVMVDANGKQVLQGLNEYWQNSPWYSTKRTGVSTPNLLYWRLRQNTTGPARMAGQKLVIWDPVDTRKVGRRIWQYIPGQRRVKLAPDLAYDTPSPQSGGSSNMDDAQVFLGAQDRFNFKLIGKRELYIPYNNYKIADMSACPNNVKYAKNFLNPDCVRFELHRVYMVEATLKPEFRHNYKRRVFYFDEDNGGGGLADNYDATNKLYRAGVGFQYPMYEGPYMMADECATYDLLTGIYMTSGSATSAGGWYTSDQDKPDVYYSPEAISGEGIR